jgi:hypothetical protein
MEDEVMRHSFVIVVVAVCVFASTSEVGADDSVDDEAMAQHEQGVAHFKAGRYSEAAASFRRANEINPSWKLQYNIGQCEALLKRYGLALDAFELYLAGGGDSVAGKRRKEVLGEVERLRKMVGSIEVRAPEGALVVVDGVERGRTPLPGRVRVAVAVDHDLVVELGDERLLEKEVRVGGGEIVVIDVSAKEDAPEPAVDTAATHEPDGVPVEDEASMTRTLGWVSVGLGGALLIGGAVTGGLALDLNSELGDECTGGNCLPDQHDDLDKRDTLAMTTNILLGAGAAAAVVGVLLLTVFDDGESEPSGSLTLAPAAGGGAVGATLDWRF